MIGMERKIPKHFLQLTDDETIEEGESTHPLPLNILSNLMGQHNIHCVMGLIPKWIFVIQIKHSVIYGPSHLRHRTTQIHQKQICSCQVDCRGLHIKVLNTCGIILCCTVTCYWYITTTTTRIYKALFARASQRKWYMQSSCRLQCSSSFEVAAILLFKSSYTVTQEYLYSYSLLE